MTHKIGQAGKAELRALEANGTTRDQQQPVVQRSAIAAALALAESLCYFIFFEPAPSPRALLQKQTGTKSSRTLEGDESQADNCGMS